MFGKSSILSLFDNGNLCRTLLIWYLEFRTSAKTAFLFDIDFSFFFDKTKCRDAFFLKYKSTNS